MSANRTIQQTPRFTRHPIARAVHLALAAGAVAPWFIGTAQAAPAHEINCPVNTAVTISQPTQNFNTCNINSGGSITVDNSGSLTNYDTLNNKVGGTLTNNGNLNNYSGAILSNAGTLTNSGNYLVNGGTLTNQAGGRLTNSGFLNNTGTLTNEAGGTLITTTFLRNYGALTNSGAFTVTSTGGVSGIRGSFSQNAGTTTVDGLLSQGSIAINDGRLAGTGIVRFSTSGGLGQGLAIRPSDRVGLALPINAVDIAAPATIAPGDAPGDIGKLSVDGPLNLLGTLETDVDSLTSVDLLGVTGAVTFGSDSLFNFLLDDDTTQMAGDSFNFFDAASFANGDLVKFAVSGLAKGLDFAVTGFDGTSLKLNLIAAANGGGGANDVPEPGALGLMGLGVVLLAGGAGWRRRRVSQAWG